MDRISVIIPTFNRAQWLGEALRTVIEQETGDDFQFDVVVVDNGSQDDTRQVAQRVATHSDVEVTYVYQDLPGDAAARNMGIRAASGQWLAFFDDDQLASTKWLRRLFAVARRHNAMVVGGPVHLDLTRQQLSQLGRLCRKSLRETILYQVTQPYFPDHLPGTGNALVAREVFDRIGLFDERRITGGSDIDFFLRARQAGYVLWYAHRAAIRHRVPPERLAPAFFRWDSLSGGAEHALHLDYERHGTTALVARCAARLAHATLVVLPLAAWSWLLGRQGELLGQRTRLWRCEGYLRRTLQILLPRYCSQESFFQSLDFRHGRVVQQHAARHAAAHVAGVSPQTKPTLDRANPTEVTQA